MICISQFGEFLHFMLIIIDQILFIDKNQFD